MDWRTTGFRRRLIDGPRSVDVELAPGLVRWLAAQSHAGENIGDSDTHVIPVELKDARARERDANAALGPSRG